MTRRRRGRPPRDGGQRRRNWAREGREQGSAVIEFVSIGVLLMVPLVYLAIVLGRVQAATFAADGSAREAARAFVTATDDDDGYRRAAIVLQLALHDQGFDDRKDATLAVRCARARCLTPGTQVVVRVEVRVYLPGIPRFIGHPLATNVTVRAEQAAVVDEFRVQKDSS